MPGTRDARATVIEWQGLTSRAARRRAMSLRPIDAELLAAFEAYRNLRLEYLIARHEALTPSAEVVAIRWLGDRAGATTLRIQLAARLIEADPEHAGRIHDVVAAITGSLGRTRSLERLIQVQHRVKSSGLLDKLIMDREARTKLACPRCSQRLTRPQLIAHLWHQHRLTYNQGRARDPGSLIERAIQIAARKNSASAWDSVYARIMTSYRDVEPAMIHQAILARITPDISEIEPLKGNARDHQSGLCPHCYACVPNPIRPLPQPLVMTPSRLAGDGFDFEWAGPAARRMTAVKWTLPVAAISTIGTAVFPPLATLAVGTALSAITYAMIRRHGRESGDARSQLVNAAWRHLVPKMGRTPESVRFLTRLCRTSLDHGDAEGRLESVFSQVEQAAVLQSKGSVYRQWFATVRVLQASDHGRIGKDWIPALSRLFAPLFEADESPIYTEAAAETLLLAETFEDEDAARLRVALAGEALAAGLNTSDYVALCEACPHLAKLFAGNAAWFDAMTAVWRDRRVRPWRNVADAQTVFEFSKSPGSGPTLAALPDTLLVDPFDRDLGAIHIGQRGITLANMTISNAAGIPALANRLQLRERELLRIRKWLLYREELLRPTAPTPPTPRRSAVLSPLAAECPLCRRMCLVQTGAIGTVWPITT
jgi:hypothetical protein